MLTAITAVWTEVVAFVTSLFSQITELFYVDGNLTFVGILAVIMAGIAIMLLVWNLIRSFFVMRG